MQSPPGVSVVICCYNSAGRLLQTLAHLLGQTGTERIPWEVVVVDNASTDGTAETAVRLWPADAPAPLRVVSEPEPGQTNARMRGFREAAYEIVSFVDDDNWVCAEWVETVSEIMTSHPEVALCGGESEAAFEQSPPEWFNRHASSFAVGSQADAEGYLGTSGFLLWGAGLSVRKAAWRQLLEAGFVPALEGRRGARLTAGDDTELCFALSLVGWKLWYTPRLKLRHYMPAGRLRWLHLQGMYWGFGAAWVYLSLYCERKDLNFLDWKGRLRHTWAWRVQSASRDLLRARAEIQESPIQAEGDARRLWLAWKSGFLLGLLRDLAVYHRNVRRIKRLYSLAGAFAARPDVPRSARPESAHSRL